MGTLTISKKITKGEELIIIPRKEYEELLDLSKKRGAAKKLGEVISEEQKWFWTKDWQKKEREADKDIKKGRVYGPFSNAKELINSLPRHPSLRIKKIQGSKSLWEGRISQNYRFTFQIIENTYLLRRIGTHNILRTP